jgi:hypothetical protein
MLGETDDPVDQPGGRMSQVGRRGATPQPKIRGDKIVAASARVDTPPGRAQPFG